MRFVCLCQYICKVRGCSFLAFLSPISVSLSPIRVLECLPTGLPLSSSIWPHYGVLSPGNCRFFCGCHGEVSLMTSSLPPCASLHYGWKVLLKSLAPPPSTHPKHTHSRTHTHSLLSLVTSLASKG